MNVYKVDTLIWPHPGQEKEHYLLPKSQFQAPFYALFQRVNISFFQEVEINFWTTCKWNYIVYILLDSDFFYPMLVSGDPSM